jgi:hypothetical protein
LQTVGKNLNGPKTAHKIREIFLTLRRCIPNINSDLFIYFQVGSNVKVHVPDGQDMVGILVKITDSSSYTVVFDDGDERTLKRTSLCIKGAKHFNESETLDHLPLTDPENFGTPVMQVFYKSSLT